MSVVYARFTTLIICEEILVWTNLPQHMEHCKALHICICWWTFFLVIVRVSRLQWQCVPPPEDYCWHYMPNQAMGMHTWDWRPMIIAVHTLWLVEKAEPVQVRLTLHLKDQRSKWMQDGCKVYMNSYMRSNGSCFMVHLDSFQKPCLFKRRPNTKSGDHGTLKAHNCWFIIFYHVWQPCMNRNPLR
jgi:hypothetical protein